MADAVEAVFDVAFEHPDRRVAFGRRNEALPKGFQRVRSYGWMSPAAIRRWQRIQALLDWTAPAQAAVVAPPPLLCPSCQKPMRWVGTFPRSPPLRYS